jgi:hypothetical protein
MGCSASSANPPKLRRRHSPALQDDMIEGTPHSLRIRVVTSLSASSISPKNSSIAELFPGDGGGGSDDGGGEITRTTEHISQSKKEQNESKYAYHFDEATKSNDQSSNSENKTIQQQNSFASTKSTSFSKRPRFINLEDVTNENFEGSASGVFSIKEGEKVDEQFVSIDDLADRIVEISTDDGSSSDSDNSDDLTGDEIIMGKDGATKQKLNSNGQQYGSPRSSTSSLHRSSSSNSLSPQRKNSANWRESAVLSPAVSRISTEIFPHSGVMIPKNPKRSALTRFREFGRKIHIGVRVGRAVNKIQDLHGMKRINQYLIIRTLGEGSYGKVKLAEDVNTGRQYAMKILRKTTVRKASRRLSIHSSTDTVAEEIAIMKKLNHPNVVKLYEVLETPTTVYLFIEFYPQGPVIDLEKEMQAHEDEDKSSAPTCPKLELETVRRYVRDIIQGLSYLHAHGVIHQDLKPNNLLLRKDGTVAISDFGISTLISSKSDLVRITQNGTPAFMAPELHGAQKSAHSGYVRFVQILHE